MIYAETWNMYDFAGKHIFVCYFLLKYPWIYFPGLPLWLSTKESACSAGYMEMQVQSLSGEDSPGEGHSIPLQYSCLENPHGQRSLVGYSPWGPQRV